MKTILSWVDGCCKGNPGPGGSGVVLKAMDGNVLVAERHIAAYFPQTTNQRTELEAAILLLSSLRKPTELTIHSDSKYLVQGMNEWVPNWIQRGWRTSTGKAVMNRELWERLVKLATPHQVHWTWISREENYLADSLANEAVGIRGPVDRRVK